MNVTKVVGFDLRIPKHLDLYFYDFSTILYGIYKFAVFENKRKRKRTFASRPLDFYFFSREALGGRNRTGEGLRRRFQRGSAPAARGKLGKRERGLSRTSGCPRFAGRRPEAAAPQSRAAGGGGAPRRQRSGEGGAARTGWRASG